MIVSSFRQRSPSIAMWLFLSRKQGHLENAETVESRTRDLTNLIDKVMSIFRYSRIMAKQALLQLLYSW